MLEMDQVWGALGPGKSETKSDHLKIQKTIFNSQTVAARLLEQLMNQIRFCGFEREM